MKKLVLILFLLPFIFACKKAAERTCWKGSGGMTDTTIFVQDFSKLTLNENINYEIIQDSLNKIEIIGGQNVIPFVKVEIQTDGTLSISNSNKCNFLRYKSQTVKVKIHCKNLSYLTYKGTEDLVSEDTLSFNNFQFFMVDGGGSIHLKLNVSNSLLGYVSHGSGDFHLEGIANKASLNIMTQGSCDTRKLKVLNTLSIVSNANSPCYINTDNSILKAEITGQGNIYYQGTPSSLFFNQIGVGELIQL
jgi:hypothetical protein